MKECIVFLALLCTMAAQAQKQNEITLHIGDPAPELKYSKWIKGTPVSSFTGNQLYILEFWATWCGPCKAAMPNLTKLQKQYEGKVTIIGVNAYEYLKEGQPYESSLPMVTKFVEGNSTNIGYNVIADNNDKYMANSWMKPAGQVGIPTTFIVKDNKIIWIGEPEALDTTLPRMIDGSYNMQAFKLAFEIKVQETLKQNAARKAVGKTVANAINAAKEYKKAIDLIDKMMVEQPTFMPVLTESKFGIILNYIGQEEAIAYAENSQTENMASPSGILRAVLENGGAKTTILWAAKKFENATPKKELTPMQLHALAYTYSRGGDYKAAISREKKAIKRAKTALKEGKFIDEIKENTVTGYEKELARYQTALKNKPAEN